MLYDEFVKTQKILLDKARLLLKEFKYKEFAVIMDSLAELEKSFTEEYVNNKNTVIKYETNN